MKARSLLILCVLLAGCGGSEKKTEPAPATKPEPQPAPAPAKPDPATISMKEDASRDNRSTGSVAVKGGSSRAQPGPERSAAEQAKIDALKRRAAGAPAPAAAPATVGSNAIPATGVYRDDKVGFSITVPPGFEPMPIMEVKGDGPKAVAAFKDEKTSKPGRATTQIAVIVDKGAKSRQEVMNRNKPVLGEPDSVKETTVCGRQAVLVETMVLGAKLLSSWIIDPKRDRVIYISCVAGVDVFPAVEAAFRAAIDSFTLD
jgi:hypothetical protein